MIWRCVRVPDDVGGVNVTLLEQVLNMARKIIVAQASAEC
jgi:hypothetical protein